VNSGLLHPVRPLTSVVRESNVRDNGKFYGPDPEDDCPCGSRRQACRCHRAADHSWIAERPPALLTDAGTGYANAGCYARSSNDCDEELTLEHYISDDVLESISADTKVVAVKGAAWQPDATEKTVGVKSLASRMLCRRHNHALSPLDKMAAEFFRYFRDDQLGVMCFHGNDFDRDFTLVSGTHLELWLLKVIWGAIEAKGMELEGSPAYRFRLGVTTKQLAEILWRGADWPPHWGMYILHNQHPEHAVKQNSVRLRLARHGSEVLGGYIQIAGIEFLISFEMPPVPRTYRPCGMTIQRVGFPLHIWKMFAFAWPELGHSIINVVSQVPPKVDFTKPPTPFAASVAGQPVPGSLSVSSGAQPDAGTGAPTQRA
jgi:hypothetical protein